MKYQYYDLWVKIDNKWSLLLPDVPISVVSDAIRNYADPNVTDFGVRKQRDG